MKKILILLITIGLGFSFYANNTTSNKEEDYLLDNNCIEAENLFLDNDITLQFTDDSLDCFDALEKVDTEYVNTDTLYQTQHFATYYFYNLRENMGFNYIGSCSYVGIAMMLSYYDSYWNDDIIDEAYDDKGYMFGTDDITGDFLDVALPNIESSPGIDENQYIPYDEEDRLGLDEGILLTETQYYELVKNQSNREEYFHYYLMGMMVTEELFESRMSEGLNPFGMNVDGRSELIEKYIEATGANLIYETVTTDVENYIINKVTQGIPVMVAVDLPDQKEGHVLVVYDYDAATGKLYANMGWMDYHDDTGKLITYTHVDLSSLNYTQLKNATTFTPTDAHSHSYNYVNWDGTTYCSCYFPCHPEHEHTYEQIEGDASQHKYTCGCAANEVNTAYHRFTTYASIDGTYHAKICADCGYSVTDEHNFSYESVNDDYHILTCTTCGATSGTRTSHSWTVMSGDNSLIGERVRCQFCGLTRLLGIGEFVPVIKDKVEDEEETE